MTLKNTQVGIPAPNPSFPQEIEVVRGKNLLDINLLTTISNNRYISSGNNHINISPNTTYTFSVKSSTGVDGLIIIYDKNGNSTATYAQSQASKTSVTFTTGANDSYFVINRWYIDSTPIVLADTEPMLEKGSTATSYLPYNTLEEVIEGKNLLNTANGSIAYKPEGTTITIDNKGVINASADMNYASINIPSITLKAGTTYTFKRNFTGSYNSLLVDTNGNNVLAIGYNNTSVTATIESDVTINKLNGALLSGDNYFQLEIGSTATTYEPYHTPISYPISLGSLEFNSIDNYTDELLTDRETKKWYKLEKIGKVVLDGSESDIVKDGARYVVRGINDMLQQSSRIKIYSNYYHFDPFEYQEVGVTFGYWISGTGHVYMYADTSITDVAGFKTWLSTHNTIVYYPLNTATLIEITDTNLINQLENWYNAQSFNGTTIIQSNGNLAMPIKVRALKGE